MRADPETLNIFDPPPPARRTVTSQAAAAAIRSSTGAIRERVYQAIVAAGPFGLTRNQLHERTGIRIQTLCPRLYELEGRPRDDAGEPKYARRIRMDRAVTRDGCHPYVAIA